MESSLTPKWRIVPLSRETEGQDRFEVENIEEVLEHVQDTEASRN